MSGDWEELPPKKTGDGWEELTPGGAAVGNPNLRRQGDRGLRNKGSLDPLFAVGGATAIGGAIGSVSKEILSGAGNALQSLPYPAARTVGGFLRGSSQIIGAGGRAVPAILGATGGAVSESAGQVVDMTQFGQENPAAGEVTRFVAGGVGPEALTLGKEALKKFVMTPALSFGSKIRKESAKAILAKLEGNPDSVSDQERAFIESVSKEIRGGPKSDAALQATGDALEEYGSRGIVQAARVGESAAQKAQTIGKVAPYMDREYADIGGELRDVIIGRNRAAIDQRKADYLDTKGKRDAMVKLQEDSGGFVNKMPEYQTLVASLKEQAKGRSPEVKENFEHILKQISPQEGRTTFQQLDDVRRALGEVFAKRAPTGYAAIEADTARHYYGQISDLQKKFVGGETGPQAKLLHDYAAQTEGLAPFMSKTGRKATAVDKFDESQFTADSSTLPKTYFKTRESVQALIELTGDRKLVNRTALEYINKELADASAKQVREFSAKNSEWLRELPMAQRLVNSHATKLEGVERAGRNAALLADEAAKTNEALIGGAFPKERIVNLVENGNMELWAKAGPALSASPQGKANTMAAIQQVIADKPLSADDFARRLRPALEGSKLADKASLDLLEKRLRMIENLEIPAAEKLGMKQRFALQAIGSYAAGRASRGVVGGYNYATGVPE